MEESNPYTESSHIASVDGSEPGLGPGLGGGFILKAPEKKAGAEATTDTAVVNKLSLPEEAAAADSGSSYEESAFSPQSNQNAQDSAKEDVRS